MNFRKAKKEAKKKMPGLKWPRDIIPRYISEFVLWNGSGYSFIGEWYPRASYCYKGARKRRRRANLLVKSGRWGGKYEKE